MTRFTRRGFTVIELLVVLAAMALLLSIAAPRYLQYLDRAREATLQENLLRTRDALDKFYVDQGRYPESLEELVTKRYLRAVPLDPITDRTDTWTLVVPPPPTPGQVADLHSGAVGLSSKGTPYARW